ncbi:MsnO8 family LLM class oxidoreductase [Rhodococcoides corynebacterioides]|uniref:MsnO8 family LLM class oxidoreductase n=1 Tax=Rhodococcoides corynebacterioides TaxID=53972 RepID=UPI003AD86729
MLVSLLDRSRTRVDRSSAAAVADTVERARWAEAAGYHRFRVAEHHAVPGIASGTPAVLLAAIGAATTAIGLGTAGVMLPNHTPLLVAENALILEALFPGRLDLGIGRSLGFTPPIRRALRAESADGFAADLSDLLGFLHGTGSVTAQPAADRPIPVSVLATGSGLEVAARLGLPVIVGGPALADPDRIRTYRRAFVPTETTPRPRVTVSADILVADSDADARVLALSEAVALAESRRTGDFPPLRPVTEMPELGPRALEVAERTLAGAVFGSRETVRRELERLVERTDADEILSSASTYDRAALRASDEALVSVLA